MLNYYHVINKWYTTDPNSPGYISGIRANNLLTQITNGPLADVLIRNNIPEEYFDLDIYTNYANTAVALSQTGKIIGFATAKLPNNSVCYSLLLYNNQADQNLLVTDDSVLINNFDTAKLAYMQLLNLQCETKRGMKDISDDLFQRILFQESIDIQELENIFSSL